MSAYVKLIDNDDDIEHGSRTSESSDTTTAARLTAAPPAYYGSSTYPPRLSSDGNAARNFILDKRGRKQDLKTHYNVNTDLPAEIGRFNDVVERHDAQNAEIAVGAGDLDIVITLQGSQRAKLKVDATELASNGVVEIRNTGTGTVTPFDLYMDVKDRKLAIIVPEVFAGAITGRCCLSPAFSARRNLLAVDEQDSDKNRCFVRPLARPSQGTISSNDTAKSETASSGLYSDFEVPPDSLNFISVKVGKASPDYFVGTREDYEEMLFEKETARAEARRAGPLARYRYYRNNMDALQKKKMSTRIVTAFLTVYVGLLVVAVTLVWTSPSS